MTSITAPSAPPVTDHLFRRMIESVPGVTYVATTTPTEQVLYVSPQIRSLVGIKPEEWLSSPRILMDHLHEEDLGRVLQEEANARSMGEPFRAEYRLVTASGKVIWVEHRTRPLPGAGSEPLWLGTIQDITHRKYVENELRSLVYLDEFTGLYNRRGFFKVAEQQLGLTQRSGRGAVLLYLDIDSLRAINDSMGHAAGDRALLDVTKLLRRCFRDSDILARTGCDEFAVWAVETDGDRGDVLRERILKGLQDLNTELPQQSRLRLSVGYAFCEPSEQVTVQTLLQRADTDMYSQKRSGRQA